MGSKYTKTPLMFQMESTECGAVALGMVLAYYGRYVSLDKLRVETDVTRDGCKASKMIQCAKKYGFDVATLKLSVASLMGTSVTPCIIHWNYNHFVVYEGIKNKHAYINDPSFGRRKITLAELEEGFTGIVLTLKPNKDFVKVKADNNFSIFAKKRLKGQIPPMISFILLGLLLIIPGIIIPVFSQMFIDDILVGGNINWITMLITAMIGTILFKTIFTFYRNSLLVKFQNKISLISAHDFLTHIFKLPLSFFDQRYSGDIASRMDNNDRVCSFLIGGFAETLLNLIVSLFYLILLIYYSPLLTAIGLCLIAVNFFIMKIASSKMANAAMKMQQNDGHLTGVILSGLSIITTLKASGVEGKYVSRVLGHYSKTITETQECGRLMQIIGTIPGITAQISSILILVVGGVLVINGNMTFGMLVAFQLLFQAFMQPTSLLMGFVYQIQQANADMIRVNDILEYSSDTVNHSTKQKDVEDDAIARKLIGHITLKNISFGYSKLEKPFISDFSFSLNSGRSVAFVGASGSGKSTISKVISGLYLPWSGEILVDDQPLSEVNSEIISSSISTISQEIALFGGSIRDNITMWNHTIGDSDMIKAAKDACIHNEITQKPDGYNYCLTENGANLSGGQRQRLEIARALVTNPTILIMDEATSVLDALSEKTIINNVKRRGCTCIVVAHRLSTIRDCDEIIVMDKGLIVQRGTHEQLVKCKGHYQTLIATM